MWPWKFNYLYCSRPIISASYGWAYECIKISNRRKNGNLYVFLHLVSRYHTDVFRPFFWNLNYDWMNPGFAFQALTSLRRKRSIQEGCQSVYLFRLRMLSACGDLMYSSTICFHRLRHSHPRKKLCTFFILRISSDSSPSSDCWCGKIRQSFFRVHNWNKRSMLTLECVRHFTAAYA